MLWLLRSFGSHFSGLPLGVLTSQISLYLSLHHNSNTKTDQLRSTKEESLIIIKMNQKNFRNASVHNTFSQSFGYRKGRSLWVKTTHYLIDLFVFVFLCCSSATSFAQLPGGFTLCRGSVTSNPREEEWGGGWDNTGAMAFPSGHTPHISVPNNDQEISRQRSTTRGKVLYFYFKKRAPTQTHNFKERKGNYSVNLGEGRSHFTLCFTSEPHQREPVGSGKVPESLETQVTFLAYGLQIKCAQCPIV